MGVLVVDGVGGGGGEGQGGAGGEGGSMGKNACALSLMPKGAFFLPGAVWYAPFLGMPSTGPKSAVAIGSLIATMRTICFSSLTRTTTARACPHKYVVRHQRAQNDSDSMSCNLPRINGG